MARIWARDEDDRWRAHPLSGTSMTLNDRGAGDDAPVTLIPTAGEARTLWCLVASPRREIRVNGWILPGGVRILSDRDEIRLPHGARFYYSDADPARVEPLPESAGVVCCGLCTAPIEVGSDAVRCPGCGVWHHASDKRDCWTYNPTCSSGDQPTSLTDESAWSPEDA